MKPKQKKRKRRVWMPKCRAATYHDKRTKRKRTRSAQLRQVLKEY